MPNRHVVRLRKRGTRFSEFIVRFVILKWRNLNIQNRELDMAYQHGRKSIRQSYEERFAPKDAREVTVHRVVNIIEKRSPIPRPGMDVDRGYDDQRYGGPRNYQSGRGYHSEDSYLPDDNQYYDENPNYGSYRRNSPPHRNDGPYPQQSYGRDDLRYQLSSR
ncbi:hypothetical protein AMECASPLE_001820 [Ameca splendens]|uniref:Uncharacterized protein n=1 Tax=Ameca splendens TaxID=208324 RepID=A0ABV0XA12_9TELE